MDILCTRCGEPFDVLGLVDDMTPEEAKDLKRGRGCPCCSSKILCESDISCEECDRADGFRSTCKDGKFKNIAVESSLIQAGLADIMGDDIDGLTASMEDFGLI